MDDHTIAPCPVADMGTLSRDTQQPMVLEAHCVQVRCGICHAAVLSISDCLLEVQRK